MPKASLADSARFGILGPMGSDLEGIRHALTIARSRGYSEVAVEEGDLKFRATLEPAAKKATAGPARADATSPAVEEEPGLEEIRSPLVGYYRPSDSPLAVGQTLTVGDVVGVVASLGEIPYAVEASVAGEVAEVLVEPDQPVEYGQVLAKVRA